METRQVLFKVLMGVGGHEYVIYDNGEIEGFGNGAIILNWFPALQANAYVEGLRKGQSSFAESTANGLTSALVGAGHGTPP
jgi:hypothetical protein